MADTANDVDFPESEPENQQADQPGDREPSIHDQIAQRISESRRERLVATEPPDMEEDVGAASDGSQEIEKDDSAPQENVTVKVYGQSYQVQKADVDAAGGIEAYQKRAAAAELLRRTNEEKKAFKEEQQRWYAERAKADEPPPQESHLEDLAKAYLTAQDAEDYKEMARTLQEIAKTASEKTKPASRDEILELMEEQERKRDRDAATTWFDSTYPNLSADATLRDMVSRRVADIERQYPHAPLPKVVEYAAEEVNAWHRKISNGGVNHQPTTPSDRVEAKRKMNAPMPASQRRETMPEQKRKTTAEIVADMQKRRGQYI